MQVTITVDKLEQLVKLMDWQLAELGFDPASVTAAWLAYTDSH